LFLHLQCHNPLIHLVAQVYSPRQIYPVN
jgi:hypothetical protein